MERLWEFSLRRPGLVLGLAAALTLGCLPGLAFLESDNTPHVFFRSDSDQSAAYARFRALFGGDEALRLVLRGDVLGSPAGRRFLGEVERGAAAIPGVHSVTGLASTAASWPPSDPAAFRAAALADPLWRNLGVVASGGHLVSVLLSLEPLTARRQAELLHAAELLLAHPPAGVTSELVGMPVLNRALDESSHDVEWKYFPLLVVLAVLLLACTLRCSSAVLLPMLFVAGSEILVFGPMGYLGVRLNMVLAVLAPLVLVIALATAVYVQVRFHYALAEGLEPPAAARAAYAAKQRPLVWTAVTTLVGFGALLLSHIGPVRALGFWCVVSTLEMLALVFFAYPALLLLFPAPCPDRDPRSARSLEPALQSLGRNSARWAIRHHVAVVACTAVAALVGLAGFPRLRVEGNALTYLPQGHPVRAGIERLESAGVGSSAVELVLTRAQGAGFDDGEALSELAFLAAVLRDESGAIGVVGLGDIVEAALRRGGEATAAALGGAAVRKMALERLRSDPGTRAVVQRFLSPDGHSTRITLFTKTVGLDALAPLLERARAAARASFPEAEVVTTGEFPLLLDMQRGLLQTLAGSLGLALVAVAGVFLHLLRSWRYTPLAVVTSLVPVVIVIGGMGWAGVPLDIATVMIASIVLGLAGDDTIHTVDRFRALVPKVGRAAAIAGALEANAPAYVVTALIRVAGFGVCAMSGFVPIHRFGVLSAAAIALAALSDLVVVAALLGWAPGSVPGQPQPRRQLY